MADIQESVPTENLSIEQTLQALREFAKDVYKTAENNGRYTTNPDFSPLIVHVMSELTEAVQAFLCNQKAKQEDVDFALKNIDNPMYYDFFKNRIKSKLEDEIADGILVLLSIAGYMKIDIAKHLVLKNTYNKLRKEHSVFNNYNEKTDTTESRN